MFAYRAADESNPFFCYFQDILDELLPHCLPHIINGLRDKDDDVKSVSAKALLPATSNLLSNNKLYHSSVSEVLKYD